MHIEPGLVDGSKIFLSYATAATAITYAGKLALNAIKKDGAAALLVDLGLLAAAKLLRRLQGSMVVDKRLYATA